MDKFAALLLLPAMPICCQTNQGELRLKVMDPAGLDVKVTVQIVSGANDYRKALVTDAGETWTSRAFHSGYISWRLNGPGSRPRRNRSRFVRLFLLH